MIGSLLDFYTLLVQMFVGVTGNDLMLLSGNITKSNAPFIPLLVQ